jgi:integration host factor subunit beta
MGSLRRSVVIKSQLMTIVAGQFRYIRQRDVEQAVDTIFDQIVSALANSDRVELRGFGSFSVRVREGRVGRDPRTGAKTHVSDKKVVNFRQSNDIHRRLNFVAPIAETPGRTSSA